MANLTKLMLHAQKNEITEHHIYADLAKIIKDKKNSKILRDISRDEKRHYEYWKSQTKKEVKPNAFKVWWYVLLARLLGLSFTLKLMERGEQVAQRVYQHKYHIKGVHKLIKDEQKHEKVMLNLIEEERLEYAGSVVLGMNDALVELSGALAGFTFAFQNSRLIALSGVIMGIAASLSMAGSEFLSAKEEQSQNKKKKPLKSSLYTGFAYLLTVVLLVLPYFLISNIFIALGIMLLIVITVIACFNFYIATAKSLKFWTRFVQMATISLGVAIVSFIVGLLVKGVLGVEL